MICKVCLNVLPKEGALVVRTGNLLNGFSLIAYKAEDHDADTNDLVCGKQCALMIVGARIDEVMGIRDAFPARAL
jgi:hypothetical protein